MDTDNAHPAPCCQDAATANCCRAVAVPSAAARVGNVAEHFRAVQLALDGIDTALVIRAARLIREAQEHGRWLFTAGNGGSAAIAAHLAGDLLKSCGVRALCLTDNTPALTAFSNDRAYWLAAWEQFDVLRSAMPPADVVFIASCSGRSANAVALAMRSRSSGANVVTVRGEFPIAALGDDTDCDIVVPSQDYEVIEDVAGVVCHSIKKLLLAGAP